VRHERARRMQKKSPQDEKKPAGFIVAQSHPAGNCHNPAGFFLNSAGKSLPAAHWSDMHDVSDTHAVKKQNKINNGCDSDLGFCQRTVQLVTAMHVHSTSCSVEPTTTPVPQRHQERKKSVCFCRPLQQGLPCTTALSLSSSVPCERQFLPSKESQPSVRHGCQEELFNQPSPNEARSATSIFGLLSIDVPAETPCQRTKCGKENREVRTIAFFTVVAQQF
jgi:hypothetical protein